MTVVEEAKWLLTHTFERMFYSDGSLNTECYFVNGLYDGEYRKYYDPAYHPNNLYEIKSYKDGRLNGVNLRFHPNGKVKIKCHYINDVRQGEFTRWYDDGKIQLKYLYKDGDIIRTIHG